MTRIVIHADDVGMCHGANRAFVELSRAGTITAGSVMVPCPWFPEIAELAAGDPTLDLGVHLTLNAEKAHYRWRPLTDASAAAGLVDSDGYQWRTVSDVRSHAHPDAVEAEWRAQVELALASGIDVTHLDAHMGAAMAPEWCDRYVALGTEYGVPVLLTRTLADYGPSSHLAGTTEDEFAAFVDQARRDGQPIFDRVLETDFARAPGDAPDYERMLGAVGELDLVFCAFHPNAPGPGEIETIEPDTWHVRTEEYELFGSARWNGWLDAQPLELTSMRTLRDEFRTRTSN